MSRIDDALLLAADQRPYYARAIAALTPVSEPRVATLAVDSSWRLYYSPEFIERLDLTDVAALIAQHEVEHLLRDHSHRRGDRNPQRWNIAADYEINDDADPALIARAGGATSPQPGLLAEEYYATANESPSCDCGSGAGGEPAAWELPADGLGVDECAADVLREAVRSDVRDHVAKHPGSVPAGVELWASERRARVYTPWHVGLHRYITALARAGRASNYTWRRVARRQRAVLHPAAERYQLSVALIVDTSGSMAAHAEVLGVALDVIRRSQCSVIECDTKARVHGARWIGGGGTDLRAGFALACRERADAIVVLTDGYTPWPDSPPSVPTIVVLTPDGAAAPSWARELRLPRGAE